MSTNFIFKFNPIHYLPELLQILWSQKFLTLVCDVAEFPFKNCTMALLPGTVFGDFWAWMFATENKSHIRCSSTILQVVVPTYWKCFSIYTARIQERLNPLNWSYLLCFSRNCTPYIILTNLFTTPSNSCLIILHTLISQNMYTAMLQTLLNPYFYLKRSY
jgi:hypothetical protein